MHSPLRVVVQVHVGLNNTSVGIGRFYLIINTTPELPSTLLPCMDFESQYWTVQDDLKLLEGSGEVCKLNEVVGGSNPGREIFSLLD